MQQLMAASHDAVGSCRLRVAFVVTEYVKTTETFILRDVMEFHRAGCDVLLFHLMPLNTREVLHEFAQPTRAFARGYPFIFSLDVVATFLGYVVRRPGVVARILFDIVSGCRRDPVTLLKSLFILPKSARIAREVREWGAVHVHAAYAGHPATAAWVVQRLEGVPFSCSSHAHDLFETQALLKQKLPEAAFVRTISDYNRRFILRHVPELADRPPAVIHVGVHLRGPPPARPPRGRTFRILYVGSLESRKGVDVLLRAVAGLDGEVELQVVGDGPERGRLEALRGALGIEDRVVFQGRKSNEAVLAAMGGADVLVVPSRIGPRNQTEGLPTVIVEAMANELPVVASRLTGIPEIVIHEETGLLVEVDDVAGLAEALNRVRDEPGLARGWASAGRQLVVREFDQEMNAAALLDLVRHSVEPAGAR